MKTKLFLFLMVFLMIGPIIAQDYYWERGLNEGLTHYWTLNGTALMDIRGADIGNQYNMTTLGTIKSVPSLISNGTESEGTGYLTTSTAGTVGLPQGLGDYAMAMWVNVSTGGDPGAIFSMNLSTTVRLAFSGSKYKLFWNGDNSDLEPSKIPTDGSAWSLVILNKKGSRITTYTNTTLIINISTTNPISAAEIIFGALSDGSDILKGGYDEIAIWNRSLTTDEIETLFADGQGISYTNIFGPLLHSPPNNFETIDTSIEFNCSFSVLDPLTVHNISLYIDGVRNFTNHTSSLSRNNVSLFKIGDGLNLGPHNWMCKGVGSDNIVFESETRTFEIKTFVENSQTYNASVVETSIETFKINISTGSSEWSSVTGILNYDGINYTGIQTGEIGPSNSIEFLATLDIAQLPTGVTSSQRPFNWIFTFVNSTTTELFQHPSQNQTVSQLQFGVCNSTGIPFVNFTIYNASTPYNKLNATFKSTWRIRTTIDSQIYLNRSYEDLTEGNGSFKFCFYPQDKSYIVDADIEIDGINSAKNFHYFVDNTLTNDTSEVSLYLIDNAQATLTTLQVNDQSQRGISDVLISIQLYDVGTDTFYNVGMAKTSDGGNDLAYLNWYDSLYKFILVKDGSTLLSTAPYKISETPQTFTIVPGLTDTFSKFRDFSYSLIFNNNTKNFVLTYIKPSGAVDSACLLVNKINSTGSYNICSTCETSSSATLYCNIANSGNGTFTGSFYATGSFWYGEGITIFQGIRSLIYEKIGLNNGAWFAFIFSGIVFSAFLISPTLGIVGLIAGVIGSSTLGFETYSGLQYYVFIILGGILVIWLLKR